MGGGVSPADYLTSNADQGFPVGSVVKSPPAKAGITVSTPGWGRSAGEGNGNPL